MKTTVEEYDACFFVNFTAENAKDASLLFRMGMNHTKKGFSLSVCADKEAPTGYIQINRPKETKTCVERS